MAKRREFFVCKECGHEEPKWLGRCPSCGSWNSFQEMQSSAGSEGGAAGGSRGSGRGSSGSREHKRLEAVPIDQVEVAEGVRLDTGIAEVNRVLGSGAMLGASVLIGGEPGIGKSTLMLQLAASIRSNKPILYISGEESLPQIRMRAERLEIVPRKTVDPSVTKIGADYSLAHEQTSNKQYETSPSLNNGAGHSHSSSGGLGPSQGTGRGAALDSGRGAGQGAGLAQSPSPSSNSPRDVGRSLAVRLVSESNLDRIMSILRREKPQVVVVDSIQTLISEDAGNVPGTVNQLKFGCAVGV